MLLFDDRFLRFSREIFFYFQGMKDIFDFVGIVFGDEMLCRSVKIYQFEDIRK